MTSLYRVLLTAILLLQCTRAPAQNAELDSLRALTYEEQSELDRAKDRYTLARAFRHANMPDSARHYLDLVLPVAETHGSDSLLARVYHQHSFIYGDQDDYVNDIAYSQKAVHHFLAVDDKMRAGDVYNGLSYAFKKIGDSRELMSYTRKGLTYADEALTLFEEIRDTFGLIDVALNRGILLRDVGRRQDARNSYERGIQLAGEFGRTGHIVGILRADLGEIIMDLDQDYGAAIEQLQIALANYRENNYTRSVEHAYRNLARAYSHKGNHERALEYGAKSIGEAETQRDYHRLYNAYGAFAEVQQRAGNYRGAMQSLKRSYRYQDSVMTLRQNELIAELNTEFETATKDLTIEAQESQLRWSRRVQYVAFGGLLLVGIVTVVLYRTARFRRRANETLATQKAVIERKNEQNEALIHEVHHRVKNNLQVISSLLSLQSANLTDTQARNAMRSSQNRVRSMALLHQNLYQGDSATTVDMEEYIDQIVGNVTDSYGLGASDRIEIDNRIFDIELDVDEAIPLGLIVNELLTNAIKYAFPDERKGHIAIDLSDSGDNLLTLSVEDDGVGMANAETSVNSTSFGTRLLGILTQQLDGELEVSGEAGTRVRLSFKTPRAVPHSG